MKSKQLPIPDLEINTEDSTISDGYILDFISGEKSLKDTPKEQVRQRIARALFHEYGISVEDMAADFSVSINGKRKKLDIAIFHHDSEHQVENLSRVVVCRQEPKVGRNAVRIRDYDQAEKDLEELETIMEHINSCKYGLWTNGLELFYLEKQVKRFEVRFEPIGDWPPADESLETQEVLSLARTRKADPEMLRVAFRRCHNFIHGNEGMPKDAAFWQFLYLIFCKMHDEKAPRSQRRFWAGPKEQFDTEKRKEIRRRIMPLFSEVKQNYDNLFRGNEEITLSDRALAFMVSELAKYEFTRTDVDAKGGAYQEIVGTNLRGDRGQYFTPRGIIKLAVEMLHPKESDRILDPACGTGGFLVAVLGHLLEQFRNEANVAPGFESTEEFLSVNERLRNFAENQVFGADFDPFLIKACQMNMVMAGDGRGHLYHINSLEFPNGHLEGLEKGRKEIPLESMDIVLTNPPFGSDIPITDQNILKAFELAFVWEKLEDGNYRRTGKIQGSVAPEVLFIERCINWLKQGGKTAIVLPDGILGNPGTEYIRWWILRHCWVLASVDIPVEAFIVEANVNILTSILFLKKKTKDEIKAEDLGGKRDYPVFMAVAEKVGVDRRGNTLYKRTPDGEEIVELKDTIERIRIGDRVIERPLRRKEKIIDNDLPLIAEKYREFRQKYPEAGL
ncbi:MAG: N-6 DNA methylase [Scytonematopsis contorta HA4267-MV1]|jgi:type I restriction enzyme M protein|nr:N-6 DNA methylase [Scytonematopsis contorta HA4267-MV1]